MVVEETKSAEVSSTPNYSVGDETTLDQLLVGGSCLIQKVLGEGKVVRRLFDMGLTPGAEVYLRKKAPLGDPLEVTLRGYELSLRKDEAAHVVVKITDLPVVVNKEAK